MSYVMRRLYLISGLPGSGKTTLASLLHDAHFAKLEGAVHVEADMWFERDNQYRFNPAELPKAHAWCQGIARMAMIADTPVVIVSNTFTQQKHKEPYYELAEECGYEVVEVMMDTQHSLTLELLAERNVHGVPRATLEKMRAQLKGQGG